LRSAKTSTSTVIELLPTDTTSAWKLTMSPPPTGCLKTKELTAIVTTCEPAGGSPASPGHVDHGHDPAAEDVAGRVEVGRHRHQAQGWRLARQVSLETWVRLDMAGSC
jgi:hypothetical protein